MYLILDLFFCTHATQMRKVTMGSGPLAVTHTALHYVFYTPRSLANCSSVCGAVCSPMLFLTLGKHPGSGCTQMVGNNGLGLNRVFSQESGTLKGPHQCSCMFKPIQHKSCMHYP